MQKHHAVVSWIAAQLCFPPKAVCMLLLHFHSALANMIMLMIRKWFMLLLMLMTSSHDNLLSHDMIF